MNNKNNDGMVGTLTKWNEKMWTMKKWCSECWEPQQNNGKMMKHNKDGWCQKTCWRMLKKNIFFLQAIRRKLRGNEGIRRMLGDDNNTRKDGDVKKHAKGLRWHWDALWKMLEMEYINNFHNSMTIHAKKSNEGAKKGSRDVKKDTKHTRKR